MQDINNENFLVVLISVPEEQEGEEDEGGALQWLVLN